MNANNIDTDSSTRRPQDGVYCPRCGDETTAPMPYFSRGMGLSQRPVAEDIHCKRCGFMGLPGLRIKEKREKG